MYANDLASVIVTRQGPWIDAMSLQKLLYYVQAWHLAITGEPAFDEKVKAWRDGPVVPQVWHERKDRVSRSASAQDLGGIKVDSVTSDIVDLVVGAYGSMSAEELSALTHTEDPWCEARGDLPDGVAGGGEIDRQTMARFYRRHRRLGGRTAADLAVGGIQLGWMPSADQPVDVDALLRQIGEDEQIDDPWGSANVLPIAL